MNLSNSLFFIEYVFSIYYIQQKLVAIITYHYS